MKLYISDTDDPYLNLAHESALFQRHEIACFLWKNRDCIIAGRNQNIYAEADIASAMNSGILPVRRYTGGGCVFHDHGNLNYSFVIPEEKEGMPQEMLISILAGSGIHAECSGRNDLTADGRKFGGTAWLYEDGWILFHGTILINTDTERMRKVLTPPKIKYSSKGFDSVKSRVVNLTEIDPLLSEEKIIRAFEAHTAEREIIPAADALTEAERDRLMSEEWIFGQSTSYDAVHEIQTENGIVQVSLRVENGRISDVKINHDFMHVFPRIDTGKLSGIFYNPLDICDRIVALIREA
jgi:lipoate-protein ligase A